MAVVLRDVEIGGLHLKNVDAVIIEGQNVPLLLGLSAIQKLGKVTLSGNRLIIDTSILTNPQLSGIRTQIESHIDKEEYSAAIVLLKRIESQDAIEEMDLFNLAQCYCYSKDYNKALMYCQQWMGTYKDTKPSHEPDICYYMGLSYMGLKSHYDADNWFAKAIRLISIDAVERTSREDANTLSYYYNQKAVNYLEASAYDNCVEAFDIATQYRMRYLGVTPEDLCAGNVKDERIGIWLYSISKLDAVFLHKEEAAERYAVLAALCGNQEAVEFCEHFKLNYNPVRK
jgi:tetratricopeptide (TPR) repeat protein